MTIPRISRKRALIAVGTVLVLTILVWAVWPSKKKPIPPPADRLAKISDINNRIEVDPRPRQIAPKVSALGSKPAPKAGPGTNPVAAALKTLVRKVEALTSRVGKIDDRLTAVETKSQSAAPAPKSVASPVPAVVTSQPPVPIVDETRPLTDAQAERQFAEWLKKGGKQ